MNKVTVIAVNDGIVFSNGWILSSEHEQDCCEHHWLSFDNIKLEDFDGMEFDLSSDTFFNKVEDYGIELIPVSGGFPERIPGYGSNNGYYSSNLSLVLSDESGKTIREYNISECQSWTDDY